MKLLFACTTSLLLFSPAAVAQVLDNCPLGEAPLNLEVCDPMALSGTTCRYGAVSCPQALDPIQFTTACTCEPDGTFQCVVSLVICPECPLVSPVVEPTTSCELKPDIQCNYNPAGCPSGKSSGIIYTTGCTCTSGNFVCNQAQLSCPGSNLVGACPLGEPNPFDVCLHPGQVCRYEPVVCANNTDQLSFTHFYRCAAEDNSYRFTVEEPVCDQPPPPTCPATMPTAGSACTEPSSLICEYEPFGCPNTTDAGKFLSSCFCNPTLDEWVCTSITVDCSRRNTFCFPEHAVVEVENKGLVPMKELEIGDLVRVRGENQFERVYSFGHYDPEAKTVDYIEVQAHQQGSRKTEMVQLSGRHLILKQEPNQQQKFVPAATLKVGDALVNEENEELVIVALKSVQARGAYAPFTPSGELIVNGMVASSFASVDDEATGKFGVSHHWIAHAFEFPHRLACFHFGNECLQETYDEHGITTWIAGPQKLAEWVLEIENEVIRTFLLILIVGVLGLFSAADHLLFHPIGRMVLTVVAAASFLLYRQKKKAKML